MTAKKDLKRRIRDRQERTGENYVVARRAVLGEADAVAKTESGTEPAQSKGSVDTQAPETPQRSPAFAVVEMDDVSAEGTAFGFRCSISIARELSDEISPRAALQRLHDAVLSTTDDPSMEAFRAVVLRGERPPRPQLSEDWQETMKRFVARVRAGIGGVSEGGTMLALPVTGKRGMLMMVCQLGFGIVRPSHNPAVTLTTADEASFYIERIAVRALR